VEAFLKMANAKAHIAFLRFPDSRSARGFLAAQPADFLVISRGVPIFLEVKHLKAPYRLPKDKVRQHAMLNKFNIAGSVSLVLVEHEGIGWRVVSIENLTPDVPSWDLREFPVFNSPAEALLSTGYFN
jgi:hypothetical protein